MADTNVVLSDVLLLVLVATGAAAGVLGAWIGIGGG